MASITKRGGGYLVRWRDPDGRQRTRTCPNYETARALRREVERTVALGRRWEPADAHALPELIEVTQTEDGPVVTGGAFADFMTYARGVHEAGTCRHYDRALRRYLQHLAEQHPRRRKLTVDLITKDSIETWYGRLRTEPSERTGRPISVATARLYVGAIQQAWEWLYDSDRFGEDTARPRRIKMPTPTRRVARAPTWDQCDRAIAACYTLRDEEAAKVPPNNRGRVERAWTWRAQLLILLRFTGLRVEQAMCLEWEDFDLGALELEVRGELGKSSRERAGRLVPISPHLAEEMATWGRREGLVLAPWKRSRVADTPTTGRAWAAAKVPERLWGGRGKGQPHHAFRKAFKTGLARLGFGRDVRDYLVGHHRGIDDHYLDTLDQAREAVEQIPPLAEGAKVLRLRAREERS